MRLQKERELIQTEIAILSLVQHKRIVTLIETFESNEVCYDIPILISVYILLWNFFVVVNYIIIFVVDLF